MTEPTVDAYLERLRSLPAAKRKLLEQRLRELDLGAARSALGGPPQMPSIVPVPRDGELPLSFSQQREWFLDQLEPGNPAYHIPTAVRLGEVDHPALAAAVNEIVRRHEALRTSFPAVDGQPRQVIAPRLALPVPLIDLHGLPAEDRQAEAERQAAAAVARPFDLERGPLLRVRLLRLGTRDHVVYLTIHHIVSDAWSMNLLISEMTQLYGAFRAGKPSPLPPLAVQYADFAAAQHRWLRGETLERLTSYWRERLSSPPPLLPLPLDRPRAPLAAARSETVPLGIDPALLPALRTLSADSGASLFMILLAALKALLRRCTGEDDVCVGTFIAGRNRPELEPLIGFFVNTLALRTHLGHDPTLRELLGRVREVTLGAYTHQDLPFEMLLDSLHVERSTRHTPLFQVMAVLENVPGATAVSDRSSDPLGPFEPRAHFDLALWQREEQGRLIGYLEYNALVFDATTVQRLGRHFQALLRSAVGDPDQPISALPLLTAAERHQLLREWSRTPKRVTCASTFGELFEARVGESPQALALIDPTADWKLTYEELNAWANRLAHHLRRHGVGPEVRVGLVLERSWELIVGILGVLKAGGAYVPLDPTYPRERLALILDDAGIGLLLTHRGLDAALPVPSGPGPAVIALDRDGELVAACPAESPACEVPAMSAAYVIYTSGSTGRPKGVVVSHRALAWYARAAIEHYALEPEDRVLQFSSISFDASVEEIFPPLARGATVVLRSEGMGNSTAELLRGLREWSITAFSPPTAFWHELAAAVAEDPASLPPGLRILCVGGERMLPDRVRVWQETQETAGWQACLMNTYGPTETTVVATVCALTAEDGGAGDPPIGRPVPNVRAVVLDERWRPAPIGVAGELAIGGDGVVRGYLGHPAATAERFVPDPWADGGSGGQRLYRTGDLARFLADGRLVVLGRVDHQVKIRGFRVEPGEVEALLVRHPGVREAAVTAWEREPGVRQLVAYLAVEEAAPHPAELRQLLAAELPEYMVPSAFERLDQLPHTPSGKIDRLALPEPAAEQPEAAAGYAPPETETEEALVRIFAQILGREEVGIYDNFFELGGHSLLTTRLISRVKRTFRIDLPLAEFFAGPTVADLAILVEDLIIAELEKMSDEEVELRARSPSGAPPGH